MTDEELDLLIERVKPDIRESLKASLAGNACHTFTVMEGTNSQTGVRSSFVLFVVHEYTAMVLEAVVQGLAASSRRAMEHMMEARERIQGTGICGNCLGSGRVGGLSDSPYCTCSVGTRLQQFHSTGRIILPS
jgi:hypothetical protein